MAKEMEEMEEKPLTTERGHDVSFKFELIPADMKWVALMSGELNNAATDFSSFANVSNDTKNAMGGSIGNSKATWQLWNYRDRLKMAQKVEEFKNIPQVRMLNKEVKLLRSLQTANQDKNLILPLENMSILSKWNHFTVQTTHGSTGS